MSRGRDPAFPRTVCPQRSLVYPAYFTPPPNQAQQQKKTVNKRRADQPSWSLSKLKHIQSIPVRSPLAVSSPTPHDGLRISLHIMLKPVKLHRVTPRNRRSYTNSITSFHRHDDNRQQTQSVEGEKKRTDETKAGKVVAKYIAPTTLTYVRRTDYYARPPSPCSSYSTYGRPSIRHHHHHHVFSTKTNPPRSSYGDNRWRERAGRAPGQDSCVTDINQGIQILSS